MYNVYLFEFLHKLYVVTIGLGERQFIEVSGKLRIVSNREWWIRVSVSRGCKIELGNVNRGNEGLFKWV